MTLNLIKRLLLAVLTLLPLSLWAEPLMVFVGVPPQKTFVEKVGGNHVQVRVMVGLGQNPHSYEPSPRQIADLSQAQLYVLSGADFEAAWVPKIQAMYPKLPILDPNVGISRLIMVAHEHEHEQHSTSENPHKKELDPHVWTDPRLVIRISKAIQKRLALLDPAHAQEYADRYATFKAELSSLDEELRQRLAPVKGHSFLVFHPAWGYFAQAYGLHQVAIEYEGKSPGPKGLAALIDQARALDIHTIFVQPQFSRQAAAKVAQTIQGQVVALNPLAMDYAANLRRVADALVGEAPQ